MAVIGELARGDTERGTDAMREMLFIGARADGNGQGVGAAAAEEA